MNAEIKQRWVDALRSGEYEQTRGTLHKGDSYCCLGVLCLVMGMTKVPLDANGNGYFIDSDGAEVGGFISNQEHLDTLGLEVHDIPPLYHMNDSEGRTFNQIADYIEASL